jgi:prepilin-type N-terminal cleavage/methylation domain-containing protein
MKKMLRKEGGFTLIELLIVLAILGILVGIVAMSVGGLTTTARTRGVESELSIVQTAIDTFITQDVLVDGVGDGDPDTAIPAVAADAAAVIEPAEGTFSQYLKRPTKYRFYWDAGGENLASPDQPAPAAGGGE